MHLFFISYVEDALCTIVPDFYHRIIIAMNSGNLSKLLFEGRRVNCVKNYREASIISSKDNIKYYKKLYLFKKS